MKTIPGTKFTFPCSPILLFRFDDGLDGKIDKQEFLRLYKVKQLNDKLALTQRNNSLSLSPQFLLKECKLVQRTGKKRQLRPFKSSQRKDNDAKHKECVRTTLDPTIAGQMHLDRDSATPMFLGQKVKATDESDSDSDDEEELQLDPKKVFEEMQEHTWRYVERRLKSPEEKKKFMNWLFLLADVDRTNTISLTKLKRLMDAVAYDNIRLEEFNCSEQKTAVIEKIMEQYDTESLGFLSKEEFLTLADIIVRLYCKKASERMVGKYVIGRKLGKGAVGVVHIATDINTGEKKAIKIIPRGDCSDLSRLDTEIRVMMMLHHPHIVELEEVLESDSTIYFVMKLCGGGNLSDYVGNKPLPESVARLYFGQLVQGMIYCHSQGVRSLSFSLSLSHTHTHTLFSFFLHFSHSLVISLSFSPFLCVHVHIFSSLYNLLVNSSSHLLLPSSTDTPLPSRWFTVISS